MSSQNPLWHSLSLSAIFDDLQSSVHGLSDEDVAIKRQKFGSNELLKEKPLPWWRVFVRQFLSPLIVILLGAFVVSGILGDWVDAWVILAAVFLNTLIGYVQEYKANRALIALQEMVQPSAHVFRNGRVLQILANEIVPGDILYLQTGDRVMADARLLEVVDLQLNEAALTGESMPIKKEIEDVDVGAILADRKNMVFAGTHVIGGHSTAIVVATGVNTEFGKIATMLLQTEEGQTPLQEELSRFARLMAFLILILIAVIFLLGLFVGKGVAEMFELSVALAVAAIPEGLLVSVTIILAIGMQRILKRRSLTRRLVAAETLGSVSVICSDKTGTLTQGDMRVVSVVLLDETYRFESLENMTDGPIKKIFDVASLCNDAIIVEQGNSEFEIKGNPTDRALLLAAQSLGVAIPFQRQEHARVGEIPFDSSRKYMVTRHVWGQQTRLMLKGAPEKVLPFFSHAMMGNMVVPFEEHQRHLFEKSVQTMTSDGLRVVALGYRETTKETKTVQDEDLKAFVFLGFLGLRDPIRKEARAQIMAAKKAGVKTVMVTGDHAITARMIGEEAGMNIAEDSVVTGSQMDAWTEEELEKKIGHIQIFARVEPRHKMRIIQAFQARGEVVAMTGDGVNDAPALKAADVGVALGSGTEVAKQAADLVLLDNNLGTITAAIEEGRVIFDNIRKVTVYLVAGSFTEIILIGSSLFFGLPLALLPTQILWINMVADSFPSIGLTFEPGEKGIMSFPPRAKNESILNSEMLKLVFLVGITTSAVLVFFYVQILGSELGIEKIRTFIFAAVGIDTLFYVYAVKSLRRSLFHVNPFSNAWLNVSACLGVVLMVVAIEIPFFQSVFGTTSLSLWNWGMLFMISAGKLFFIEFVKEFFFQKQVVKKRAALV